MLKINNWFRNKIRQYLGIEDNSWEIVRQKQLISDLVHIGVDVYFKSPHMILIYSKLKGGQIRHIDVNFNNLNDLHECVKLLKEKYQTKHDTWDCPSGFREWLE